MGVYQMKRKSVLRKKREQAARSAAAQVVRESIDLPDIARQGTAHLEVSGNREAVVDGCKGILRYDDGVISLNVGRGSVTFRGARLCMNNMKYKQAVITGTIASIEFEGA